LNGLLAWSLTEALGRNWAIVAMLSTIAVLLVVPALVLMKYVRISLNIMRTTRPPLSRNPLDFARIVGEPVSFTAFDGIRLVGMLVRASPDVPRKGMIVFAHEFCSDQHSCARYCRPLQEVGYDVFAFDFRGHGQSECDPDYTPRQWVTDRDLSDLRGAIAYVERWLEAQGYAPDIGIVGVSRGACAAVVLAAADPNIRAIACDGLFSTDLTIEGYMKRWAYIFATVRVLYENHHPNFWRFLRWTMMAFARREFGCTFPSVFKAIQRMTPRPLLLIHGEKDSYLPVEQCRRLYAVASQPKWMWIAPGARHNQAAVLHPETYARMTIAFFDRYLSGQGAALETPPREPAPRGVEFEPDGRSSDLRAAPADGAASPLRDERGG